MARGPERRSGVERRVADIGPAVLGERDRRSGKERRRYNVADLSGSTIPRSSSRRRGSESGRSRQKPAMEIKLKGELQALDKEELGHAR